MSILLLLCALVYSVSASTQVSFADTPVFINATDSHPASNRINGQIVQDWELKKVPYVGNIIGPGIQCTGVLIRPRWVLTAAHCLVNASWTVTFTDGKSIETIAIEDSKSRPEFYQVNNVPYGNDVGLIQLNSPSKFDPIAMMRDVKNRTQSIGTAYGYGKHTESGNLVNTGELRTTSFTLTSNDDEECDDKSINTIFCPQVQEERDGMCPGDSGGPLIIEENEPLVYGIHSASYPCLTSKYQRPSFEFVPYHYQWIVDTIDGYEEKDVNDGAGVNTVANISVS